VRRVFESAGGRLVPESRGRIGGGGRREAASDDGEWRNRHCGDRGLPTGPDDFFEIRIERPQQDSNLRTRLRRPLLYPLSYGGLRIDHPVMPTLTGLCKGTSRKVLRDTCSICKHYGRLAR
jgi:hypothetical protein